MRDREQQTQLVHVKSRGPLDKIKMPRHRTFDGVRQTVHSGDGNTVVLNSAFADT